MFGSTLIKKTRQFITYLLLGYLFFRVWQDVLLGIRVSRMPVWPQNENTTWANWIPLLGNLSFILTFVYESFWLLRKGKTFRDCSLYQLFIYRENREMDEMFWLIAKGNLVPPILAISAMSSAMAFKEWLSSLGWIDLNEWMPDHFLLQALLGFFIGSLLKYIFHRLQHSVPELWELHKIHHSADEMTCLTVFRENILLDFLSNFIKTFSLLMLGLNDVVLAPLLFLQIFQSGVTHSKCQSSWGWIGEFFTSPLAHWIHHSHLPEHYNCNFGTDLIVWDRIFGTYYSPKKMEKEGLKEVSVQIGLTSDEYVQDFILVALLKSFAMSFLKFCQRMVYLKSKFRILFSGRK